MTGMLDKLFEEKMEKVRNEFDQRLLKLEQNLKAHLDKIDKKLDDISSKLK